MICKNCNSELGSDVKVCPWCGTEVKLQKSLLKTKKFGLIQKRWPYYVGAAIVSIAIALLFLLNYIKGNESTSEKTQNKSVISLIPTQSAKKITPAETYLTGPLQNLFYFKKYKIFYTSLDQLKPREVIHNSQAISNGSYPNFIQTSEDGRQMFYVENRGLAQGTFNLFHYNLLKQDMPRTKIDTNVEGYVTNQDGSKIYYIKNKNLYFSDDTHNELINSNIKVLFINKQGDKVVYQTQDGTLFQKTVNQDKEKIDENVTLQYVSLDLNTIYYLMDGSLYLLRDGNETVKIGSGIDRILSIYQGDKLYYLKSEKINMKDYVYDDMSSADGLIKKPKRSDYSDYKKFSKANKRYQEKLNRDTIREALKTSVINYPINQLYFYSDGQSKLVSDHVIDVWINYDEMNLSRVNYFYIPDGGTNLPVLAFSHLKNEKLKKIKLSDIPTVDNLFNVVTNQFGVNMEEYLCQGSDIRMKIADKKLDRVEFDMKSRRLLYTIAHQEVDRYRWDLYVSSINDDRISGIRRYAKDIGDIGDYLHGKSIVYFKITKESEYIGDMYVDNQKVDTNVSIMTMQSIDGNVSFLYTKNYLSDTTFTLMLYDGKETKKIADKVINYKAYDKNKIVYLTGPVNEKQEGKLYLYDGTGESQLMDTGVSGMVSTVEDRSYALYVGN